MTVQQTDINARNEIEIVVSTNGGFVWVNIDGECALRVKNIGGSAVIVLHDMRKPTEG